MWLLTMRNKPKIYNYGKNKQTKKTKDDSRNGQ